LLVDQSCLVEELVKM